MSDRKANINDVNVEEEVHDFRFKIGEYIIVGGGACPEQYDVILNKTKVGYLRLRHGRFTAEAGKKPVYEAYPEGDGIFTKEERLGYLNKAIEAIDKELVKSLPYEL
jgi:hypothetical protein